ncbi:MAG: hypothetical protein ACMUIM_11320 [bacterium]
MFFSLIPHIAESASVKTTLDAKYIRTNTTENNIRTLENEYNPRLSVKYTHPLTRWTDLSGEARFDYKKEDIRAPEGATPQEDTETREPQIELRLKSLIYDFKTGFKETWTRKQTENRAFGHLLIQPSELPELRVDYDHDERKDRDKKDKITLGTIYKPSKSLRVKLDLKHEYTDNLPIGGNPAAPDEEELDLTGEIKLNHALSTRSPIKLDLSYKVESLYQEQKDPNQTVDEDKLLQTIRGKVSYRPTNKTDISLEYENKKKDDRAGNQDNTDQDIQFDLSQKVWDWLSATGRIKKETKEEQSEATTDSVSSFTDTDKTTLQGQIRAIPTDWFQLTLKVIDETIEKIEETDPNSMLEKEDKTILEASLRSDFPNLLRSYQTLDFKTVDEDKSEATLELSPYSKEERFMWKWSIEPIDNLTLKPEYIRSLTQNLKEDPKRDTTREYKFNLEYKLSVNDTWTVNFSHATSRKRITTDYTDPNSTDSSPTERNDDSSLEIDFQPYDTLFITSQITRKDYQIKGGGENSKSEEMSYSLKYDWSLTPFTWSTSYKYDNKLNDNDTETFESKIILDFSDYTVEGEYKFTQTFLPGKDKEDIVTLRFKAVF